MPKLHIPPPHRRITASRIRHYRTLRGYTQEELGDRTSLSQWVISRLECGLREPFWYEICSISIALDVDLNFFWEREARERSH